MHLQEGKAEDALTGESVPVDKQTAALPAVTALAERRNRVYSAILVVTDMGWGLSLPPGSNTQIGRINVLLAGVEALSKPPLLRQIADFSRTPTVIILVMAALTFAIGVGLRGEPPKGCSWPPSRWPSVPSRRAFRRSLPSRWRSAWSRSRNGWCAGDAGYAQR